MKRGFVALAVALGCLCFLPEAPAKPAKGDDLAEKVRTAIKGGIKYLRGQQLADGSWEVDMLSATFQGGWTSLTMLALLNAGVPPQDKMMQKGLKYLRNLEPTFTYVRALQTMVYVEAGQAVDKQRIQQNVDWLIRARVKNGDDLLGWTYTAQGRQLTDNSNTQYALLGLHAGHLAGANIPKAVWKEIQDFYLRTQNGNGGYGYNRGNVDSSLTMTTAGLCGLIISGLELNSSRETNNHDGTFKKCGEYEENPKLQKTLNLIGDSFTVNLNTRVYYNLYGIERVGRLSGLRFLGAHDWYREGCKFLVGKQGDGGAWTPHQHFDQWPVINTSFALLFLSKGRTPVLISKMVHGDLAQRYGRRPDWNNDRNDAKHLTEFVSKELFKRQPLAWQSFDGFRGFESRDEANDADKLSGLTAELLQSPIAYFNGHQAPEFKDVEIELLKKFADNGGFILAEACCGKQGFHKAFTDKESGIARQLFPDNDLEPLDENHPVWTAFFKVPANKPFKLMGIKRGCKTVLIYSPQDLSCYWESNKVDDKDPNYLLAFRLGANIVAYATGLELPDVRLKEKKVLDTTKKDVPRNAIKPAQIRYTGDWQPAPKAMSNLMDFMEEDAGLNVDRQTEGIYPDSRDIIQFKFLYMHGNKKFAFDNEQLKHLRFNLKTGGTLLADACCGGKDFDKSFRVFMKQLFPDNPLVPIPVDKEERLFSAELNGEKIDESNIRCRIKRSEGKGGNGGEADYRNMAPALEGIKIGNRWVVIYSKYDIGCALEKHQSTDCLGYDHASALKLGRAAVLYALKR
jgi:hypothetical protein